MARACLTLMVAGVLGLPPVSAQIKIGGAPKRLVRADGTVDVAQPPKRQEGPGFGVTVHMFESSNLDRFLRKAQDFLVREDHIGAIKVLQDVVEGRSLEFMGGGDELPAEEGPEKDSGGVDQADADPLREDHPEHAVFSADGRLYRPVRRLCQELLASMPEEGLALYCQEFEVLAARAYEEAARARDVRALEEVYNRWFVTSASAKAMSAAADLQMHEGRFRTAVQTLRSLLDIYPERSRARVAGHSDLYARLKIALCFWQMGERSKLLESLADLSRLHPGASVRLLGELLPVENLAEHALFAGGATDLFRETASEASAFYHSEDVLVPIWEYRFLEGKPYGPPSSNRNQSRVWIQKTGGTKAVAPRYRDFGPGTAVVFDGSRALLMDHYRMRALDLRTGLIQEENDGPMTVPRPKQNHARSRVPVYDWATLRPTLDKDRYYAVIGPRSRSNLSGMAPVLKNELLAVSRETLSTAWSSDARDQDFSGVTFLAAPTVFGERLLVPILAQGAYALQCIESSTGAPVYRVHIHSGGSTFARAPSVPAIVYGGTAFVLSNAGTIAAIDAYTGTLLWVRKYERTHPTLPKPRAFRSRNSSLSTAAYFQETSIGGFVPSEMIVADGRVIFAPADGKVLMCLDGASGEPLWMAEKDRRMTRGYIIGHNKEYMFTGGSSVVCIEMASGIRRFELESPEPTWRGRGVVTEEHVVLPGDRSLWLARTDGTSKEWASVPLSKFLIGREPLQGEFNLFLHGPYVAACYQGGIELFGSRNQLHDLAAATRDPGERATMLLQTGDYAGGLEAFGEALTSEGLSAELRGRLARRALTVMREFSIALANDGAHDEAIALLDRCKTWIRDPDLRVRWQLTRLELFRVIGDQTGVDREQARLHAMMGGKR